MTTPRRPTDAHARSAAAAPSAPGSDRRDEGGSPSAAPPGASAYKEEGGQPETSTRLTSKEIHDNVEIAAHEELERPAGALLWSALAAGLTIGFSFVIGSFLTTLVAERYHELVVALAYPIGFVLVVMAGQQLFTENTLEPIIPLLEEFGGAMLLKVLRLWGLVLAANMVGALIFAFLLGRTQMLAPELREAMDRVAEHAVSGGMGIVLYKAVFAGWLVALMAWLVAATRYTGAQIALIWLTTGPIAALGFKHSIAGSVEAFYLAGRGIAGWGEMVGAFVVPAILGNIVGGVLFVALLNHGQVATGKK